MWNFWAFLAKNWNVWSPNLETLHEENSGVLKKIPRKREKKLAAKINKDKQRQRQKETKIQRKKDRKTKRQKDLKTEKSNIHLS